MFPGVADTLECTQEVERWESEHL